MTCSPNFGEHHEDLQAVRLHCMSENLIQLQSETLAVLRKHVPAGTNVALIDFPRHQNSGDSLIWLGERRYLERLGVNVKYVSTIHHFSAEELVKRVPVGPIVLHGGGNLGDRWTHFQKFRQEIVRHFPDRKIIQLPQTMEFVTAEGLADAQKAFNSHPDLTILIRERDQVTEAQRNFPNATVEFCPDSALGNGLLSRIGAPKYPILSLRRTDSERVESSSEPDIKHVDWGLRGPLAKPMWRALRFPEDVARVIPARFGPLIFPAVAGSLEAMAAVNVKSAIRILSEGEVIVTDRLHAMILAALLNIPVVAHNNANGKVRNIYQDYIHRLPNVHLAGSVQEALDLASSLVRQREGGLQKLPASSSSL